MQIRVNEYKSVKFSIHIAGFKFLALFDTGSSMSCKS